MDGGAIQRFRIIARLGAGGMGIVYRAYDPQLEREVAIKVLSAPDDAVRAELPSTRTLVLRDDAKVASSSKLLAEARIMARLSHPNVVPVYEVGLDGNDLFVVMEYVDGEDLRSWLATPRTTREILAAFAQAARGLEAAHARNIVHRDFKPENVLIGRDGRVRVVDFGLSWLTAASPLIRVIDQGGTPRYMAPELWRGTVTPAADVYAACMATAEAFGCDARDPTVDVPAVLRARRVPAQACAMIAAGLAQAPERRPAIGQIVAALDRRSSRSRTIAAAVAAAVAAVAVLGALSSHLAGGPSPAACTDDASLLDGRWSATVRDQLRAKLVAVRAASGRDSAHRALDAADTRARELVAARRQICEAEARAEITAAQGAQRVSCLERRAMELGAVARVPSALARASSGELEERFLMVTR